MDEIQSNKGKSKEPNKVYDTFVTSKDGAENAHTNGFTIQEAIEHIGFGPKQIQIGICASIVQSTDGIEIMALSILGPALLCEWRLSIAQEAMVTTAVFAGFFIGAIFFGYLSDVFGRKKSMILSAAFVFYYGLLSSFSPTYTWLLILRFAVGFGVSGASFCSSYYLEFLPVKGRGKLIVLQWIFFSSSGAITTLLALLFMRYSWRLWLAILSLPSLIFLFSFMFLPPSPRYELACGRKEAAYNILKTLAKSNGKEMPAGELLDVKLKKRGHFFDLFKPGYRLTSVLLSFVWFALILNYYGATLLTTELVKYGTTCKSDLDLNEQLACSVDCRPLDTEQYLAILWTTLADILGTILTAFVVDILGRKKMMILQVCIFSVCCILLIICMSSFPMIVTLFAGRAAAAGASIVIYLYTAEVYPTEIRALASGIGASCGRIGAIVTPYLAQVLLNWSLPAGLSVYGSIGLLSVVALWLLPIETKQQQML